MRLCPHLETAYFGSLTWWFEVKKTSGKVTTLHLSLHKHVNKIQQLVKRVYFREFFTPPQWKELFNIFIHPGTIFERTESSNSLLQLAHLDVLLLGCLTLLDFLATPIKGVGHCVIRLAMLLSLHLFDQ